IKEARAAITSALSDPETKDLAETWYIAGLVENKQFDIESEKEILGQTPNADLMYPALDKILPYFLTADSLDQLPDSKGKIKPKYRKDIKAYIQANRNYYINAARYFYDKEDFQSAYKNFKLYGDIPNLPIFEGDPFQETEGKPLTASDTVNVRIRYFAALSADLAKLYDDAIEIYEEIKDFGFNEETAYKRIASLYYLQQDTANYAKALEAGADKFPNDPYYVQNLINVNVSLGKIEEAKAYLIKATQVSPNNPELYKALGQVYESDKNNEKAIENLEKALELDPAYQEALSLLGRIYYNMGVEKRSEYDNVVDKKQYEEGMKSVHAFFEKAIPYFEKSYQLDPKDSDAIFALRNIYYSLGRNEDYERMDKIYSATE
ncbi:MAG: tetratricopeptide repeat protein, partial [Dysgonamonadaceae bacterium]|nr:tetratricopeptide repeat protein [Dysgonamonadaceae bacterium]